MTLFNIVSLVILAALVIAAILAYRHLKKKTQEAEGFLSLNERGDTGTSLEGDRVGEL